MREDEAQKVSLARIGSVINGKWTIDRLIGVGGMASVYAATHRNTKRAALKIMHPELSAQATIRERFLREGYLANMVDHPGVVSIDDDDITEDGCAYLVMELVEGETLEARLRRKGPLPPEEVLSFMDQVLHALATAHTRGVVHRDLKPENMLLGQNGEVKLLDFGIARARALSTDPTKTLTEGLMGTPAFMPPEQARGRWEEVDAQSDVWALGATMFTLLTGRNVHQAATTNEALAVAMMRHAPRLEEYRADLPTSLLELVNKALEFEKKDRWPNATVMLLAVRRASSRLDDETLEIEAAAAADAVHSDSQPELFFAENDASDTYIESVNEAEVSDPDASISGLSSPAPFDPPTNPLSSAPPSVVERAFAQGSAAPTPSGRRSHTSDPPPRPPAPPRASQRPPAPSAALTGATPEPPASLSAPGPVSQPSRPPPAPAAAPATAAAPAVSAPRLQSQPAFAAPESPHDDDPSLRIATPVYQGPTSAPAPSAPGTENPFYAATPAPAAAALAVATANPAATHDSVLPARRVVPFSDVPVAGAVVLRPTETTTARSAITAAVRAPSRQQWSLIGAGVLAFIVLLVVVLSGGDGEEPSADAGAAATLEAAEPAQATPPPVSPSPPKPATSPRVAKAKKKSAKVSAPIDKAVRSSAPVGQAVDLEELPVEGSAAASARPGATTSQRRPAPKAAKTDGNIFNQAKNLAVKRATQRSGTVKTGSGD